MHAGTITVGPASEPITLGPGDYARYSGDGPHVYRSAGDDVRGMLLVAYPPALRPEASRPGHAVVRGNLPYHGTVPDALSWQRHRNARCAGPRETGGGAA